MNGRGNPRFLAGLTHQKSENQIGYSFPETGVLREALSFAAQGLLSFKGKTVTGTALIPVKIRQFHHFGQISILPLRLI